MAVVVGRRRVPAGLGLACHLWTLTGLLVVVVASKKTRGTFQRMQQQTSGGQGSSTSSSNNIVASILAPAGSLEKLTFIQNAVKNGGIDSHQVMTTMVNSQDFQKLYNEPEVLHKIMEANPLLHAIDGFRQASGRRLSDADTIVEFKKGVQNLLKVTESTVASSKDPSSFMTNLGKLAAEDDDVKAAMDGAKSGTQEGVETLQKVVAEKTMPGFDWDKFQEVSKEQTFDSILKQPELMHFIDQDKYMSDVFRKGHVLPGKIQEVLEKERAKARK